MAVVVDRSIDPQKLWGVVAIRMETLDLFQSSRSENAMLSVEPIMMLFVERSYDTKLEACSSSSANHRLFLTGHV